MDRDVITDKISKYMTANGYVLSPRSKNYHALDSFVYEYVNCVGVKDNIKIEINYMLRKCAVFYGAIGSERPPKSFEIDNVGKVSKQQIKQDLDPVLRKGERFELEVAQKEVCEYLASILRMTEEEEKFWKAFGEGKYCPELIFGVTAECANIEKHPMALWKCRDKGE